ncbi:MAG: 2OG-Fe(II) oxygenase [Planctomycetota bacterium]|nr:2OG-Fe(II) oxygenase [Planctomycetota bacterium]
MPSAARLGAIRYVPGALRPDECAALIGLGETAGFAPAPIEGAQELARGFRVSDGRDNARAAFEDAEIAERIWTRVAGQARELGAEAAPGAEATGLNERLRLYRYDEGQRFPPHADGYYVRPGERSLLTLLLYLNEGYEGGETCFAATEFEAAQAFVPRTGAALIFPHERWHEGRPVLKGRKYVLRTDVMFRDGPSPSPARIPIREDHA